MRHGHSVWALGPDDPAAVNVRHEQLRENHRLLVRQLPAVAGRIRSLLSPFDAFDVLAAMQVWIAGQPELDTSRSPEIVVASLELAAMFLLERPSRHPLEVTPTRINDVMPTLLTDLHVVLGITPAELSGSFDAAPDDPPAEFHDRFVARLLLVPMNERASQATRQVLELFGDRALNRWLQAKVGFSAQQAVDLALAVGRVQVEGLFEQFEQHRRRSAVTDADALGHAASFTVEALAQAAGVEHSVATAFTDCLAQPFSQPVVRLPTLTMPVRHRPLLRDGDRFLAPVPALVPRVLRSGLTAIANPNIPTHIPGDKEIFGRLTDVRGRLLEETTVKLLTSRLRADMAEVGVRFAVRRHARRLVGEIDGLVLLDGCVIVVQAKAGATRIDAVASDRAAFTNAVGNIVTEAMRQHDDARAFLTSAAEDVVLKPDWLDVPVRGEIHAITTTLEDLAGCSPLSWRLPAASLATEGPLPWISAAAPLETMLDLIDFPAQFVHFLERRRLVNQRQLLWAADEMDVFLEYLHDRLGIATADAFHSDGPKALLPAERHHALDRYLLAKEAGEPLPRRPRMKLHAGIRELLRRLDDERPSGWLAASLAVLDVDVWNERRVGSMYRRIVKSPVPLNAEVLHPNGSLLVLARSVDGSSFHPERARAWMALLANQHRATRWVGIALPRGRGAPIARIVVGKSN